MYTILNDRSIVRISGEDRFKFLQGLISNDVNKLNEDNALYACMLTPQGKYFADFFLKSDADSILLDLPALRKEEILKKLNMYKLRSAVSLMECPEYKIIYFKNEFKKLSNRSFIFSDPRSKSLGLRGIIHQDDFDDLTKDLENNQDIYDLDRIENFIAEGEKDLIAAQSFLLEYGFDQLNAIDYKKGCYVGQELVARTHYRGAIRKQVVQVDSVNNLPALNTPIYVNDHKVGIICSSINNRGLALVRTQDIVDAVKITTEGQEIQIKFKKEELC
jgi:tRNA-modifying protein YgfZ